MYQYNVRMLSFFSLSLFESAEGILMERNGRSENRPVTFPFHVPPSPFFFDLTSLTSSFDLLLPPSSFSPFPFLYPLAYLIVAFQSFYGSIDIDEEFICRDGMDALDGLLIVCGKRVD